MVVLNQISRYHLAMLALRRVPRLGDRAAALIERCRAAIDAAVEYGRQHFEDPPEIQNWTWTD
jgi:xylulose-5-phosphate/fructose-6-phosphate phosphoketolase